MNYELLHEDEHLLVVNKPAGLLTIPDRFGNKDSLLEGLQRRFGSVFTVHRLDRETSGVLCFARSEAAHRRMRYQPIAAWRPDVPAWVDEALEKALHPDPFKRFEDTAEFVHALSQPAPESRAARAHVPLAERNPLRFWKGLSLLLAVACVALLGLRALGH